MIFLKLIQLRGFPGGSDSKESACNAGDTCSVFGSGRSPGEGNGNSLQYSCLENPMDEGAWWATVHGITKSQTQLSDFTSLHFITYEACNQCHCWWIAGAWQILIPFPFFYVAKPLYKPNCPMMWISIISITAVILSTNGVSMDKLFKVMISYISN